MLKPIIRKINNNNEVPWDLLMLADPSKVMIKKYLKDGETYIAVFGKQIIGAYVLVKISSNSYELKNIAVALEYQGQGLGKLLVLDSIKKAKQLRAKKIEVGTGNSSLSQLGLYQKCGFRISGIKKDFFLKNYPEEIIENGIKCVDMIRLSLEVQ
jgi:ribosomal protein S18 acetylase RimI-like enzyme